MSGGSYQVHVQTYKNGSMRGEIKENDVVLRELYQDWTLNPNITRHLLRKQVEWMVWMDRVTIDD